MAAIVLAIAEGAHAVLPGLAPMNVRQRQQHAARPREWCRGTVLKSMLIGPVVIYAGWQSRQIRADQVALGGVQVATGRVAAQGPAIAAVGLPGRESERQLKQVGDIVYGQRLTRRPRSPEQFVPAD